MAKKKLQRFAEMETFSHVIQASFDEIFNKDYKLKGKWSKEFFKNGKPIVLELGCGKGEYTVGLARNIPDRNYLGIDIKGARMWRGAKTALDEGLDNVGFIRTRIDFMRSFFTENEVSEIWITFPDPQPKKYYKRLTSSRFLTYYQDFVKDKGIVNLKTDNTELYQYTKALIQKNSLKVLEFYDDLYTENKENEILSIRTFYESQFLKQGKEIHYIKFELEKDKILHEPNEK